MIKHTVRVLLFCLLLGSPSALLAQDEDIQDRDEGGQQLAQTGMKFLSVSLDARAAAMGSAMTAQEDASSAAMFYNPAAMARLSSATHLSVNRVQWIGDVNYNGGGIAFKPLNGRYGVIGVSLVAVDYGELEGTIRADNEQGYEDLGSFSPSALSAGIGYAQALTDRFSVGGNVKYVRQSLGASTMERSGDELVQKNRTASTVAFDFGVIYQTGFRSLNFAVGARNFSQELTYAEESFELPLTMHVGVAMDMMDLTRMNQDMHSLLLSVDAERPRDYDEQIKTGLEYRFMDIVALRAGYVYPSDERGYSLGVGLKPSLRGVDFGFDYAYTRFGDFGNVNRLSAQFAF